MKTKTSVLFIFMLILGCAQKTAPYADGPVMRPKHIRSTFTPILKFLEAKPGITFADVGAGSGALTVMMTSLLDGATIYIQDIDSKTLRQENVDKIIDYHSHKLKKDLRKTNNYSVVIGDPEHTNLPDGSIDLIYTNATLHVMDAREEMLQDMKRKLAPDGRLFIRDSFKNDNEEGEYCSDETCGKPLLAIEDFLALMKANGFKLVKRSPNMSGYPVFGFVADRPEN